LKAEFLGISADELMTNMGSIPVVSIINLVRGRDFFNMREEMAKGIREVIEVYGTLKDPQSIDIILDRACYRDINTEIVRLKNDFIKGYFALKIDTINLMSFVRTKEMNRSWDYFSKIYIEGGNIPEKSFINGYKDTLEQFAGKMALYGLESLLLEGTLMIKETGRFTALEKLCDNLLIDYVQGAKYIPFGIEPLVGYIVAKENEIKTARIIMAGMAAMIPPELIKERIRNTYV
jgi:V/A-type H+-transporting ATPase subunit C